MQHNRGKHYDHRTQVTNILYIHAAARHICGNKFISHNHDLARSHPLPFSLFFRYTTRPHNRQCFVPPPLRTTHDERAVRNRAILTTLPGSATTAPALKAAVPAPCSQTNWQCYYTDQIDSASMLRLFFLQRMVF
jgi:hypothetical protein